jgi:hypothetical protein
MISGVLMGLATSAKILSLSSISSPKKSADNKICSISVGLSLLED